MIQFFNHINKVKGELNLAGDKSISHRVLLISALAKGDSIIKNHPKGTDILSTVSCLKELGIEIVENKDHITVKGKGYKGFKKPSGPLYAGNSGTTARLLSGILVAQDFESSIIGDPSLMSRPMKRIVEPLSLMGGKIFCSDNGTLPLDIKPNAGLKAINYELPIASAQVKSTILFTGLHAEGITSVTETIPTRDHTRRLLSLRIEKLYDNKTIHYSSRENYPGPKEYFVPGDISSAMFFIVLTLLTENSEVVFKNISLNPTRTASIDLLKSMGANIQTEQKGESNNEPYGDLIVRSCKLVNINIKPEMIPQTIDEIPALAVAGLFAEGDFELRNAMELKVKESDRIRSLCYNFSQLGLNVEEFNDGFRVSGQIRKKNPIFKSFNDHRISMTFAVLSSILNEGGSVDGFEFASVSNPDFLNQLRQLSEKAL